MKAIGDCINRLFNGLHPTRVVQDLIYLHKLKVSAITDINYKIPPLSPASIPRSYWAHVVHAWADASIHDNITQTMYH